MGQREHGQRDERADRAGKKSCPNPLAHQPSLKVSARSAHG
jgi:hypothetical protein